MGLSRWKVIVCLVLAAAAVWGFSHWRYSAGYGDADRASAVSRGLHAKADELARRLADRERACGAGTPGRSEAKASGAALLADLFKRADERAGELAREADEARARGLACEAAYDAVKSGGNK